MVLVGQPVENSDLLEHMSVLWLERDKQNGDAAMLEMLDDVAERLCSRCIEDVEPAEPQDHDLDVGDIGEFEQEALGGAKAERPVEVVGDAVLGDQLMLGGGIDIEDRKRRV